MMKSRKQALSPLDGAADGRKGGTVRLRAPDGEKIPCNVKRDLTDDRKPSDTEIRAVMMRCRTGRAQDQWPALDQHCDNFSCYNGTWRRKDIVVCCSVVFEKAQARGLGLPLQGVWGHVPRIE